jgi:hypothetical protein
MRALSIRQPWAWLVVNGHKPIENRTWTTNELGEILIHAGKSFEDQALRGILAEFPHLRRQLPEQYELGGVVGVATLAGWVHESPSPWFTGPYGLLLKDARPLPFVPWRGQLGFFDIPTTPELEAALRGVTPAQAEAAGQARLL